MKYMLLLPFLAFSLNAKTTLCYKNNWNNPATIESQQFQGSICKGKYSIDDMKKIGWKVEDIKISTKNDNFNYIYILKQSDDKNIDVKKIDYAKLEAQMKKAKQQKAIAKNKVAGKNYYIKNCQSCHGVKGEIEASGTSRAINTLSKDEFIETLEGYRHDSYDRGLAILMKPYIAFLDEKKMVSIYNYLQKIQGK
jgi:cytochrome c553